MLVLISLGNKLKNENSLIKYQPFPMWTLKRNGRAMADLTGSTSRIIKISEGNKNTTIVLPCPYPHAHSPFS